MTTNEPPPVEREEDAVVLSFRHNTGRDRPSEPLPTSTKPRSEARDRRNAARRAKYAADRDELDRRRRSLWSGDRYTVTILGQRIPWGWVMLVAVIALVAFFILFGGPPIE